ncbi:histone acetyltransferase p300-like isoform X1 [Mauremys mutica]|uniref:histone acetyltransferase p300-like isoform X1 n=1 Tax=Mauremys mutica TaxID=74926 RepID=UPI001D1495A6|nr:histone acetyltransferase p300-like isoform X1 [Mauremys mutica]XP_044857923.1 histone acetyltransferase p300-like isoform X1 [Mauremys mutica]
MAGLPWPQANGQQPEQSLQGPSPRNPQNPNTLRVNAGVEVPRPSLPPDSVFPLGINFDNPVMGEMAAVANLGPLPRAPQSSSTDRNNQWQESVSLAQREHVVRRIVQMIYPNPDPAVLGDERMERLVSFARRVEGESYDQANSRCRRHSTGNMEPTQITVAIMSSVNTTRIILQYMQNQNLQKRNQEEYHHLLTEKIHEIHRHIQEVQENRLLGQQGLGVPPAPQQQGPGMGQP